MIALDKEQDEAAHSASKDTLVLAGAGSGKTRVITARLGHLVEGGVSPGKVAAISFTNAGATVMRQRFGGQRPGFCGTLHGLMLAHVISDGKTVLCAEDADEMLIDTGNSSGYRCSKELLFQRRKEWWRIAGTPPRELSREMVVVQSYYQNLLRFGMIDYDGILWLALAKLRAGSTIPFTHILWDEFQDSAEVDLAILDELKARQAISFFVVGDYDQSIYSFRGGRVENIVSLAESGLFSVLQLTTNYRCAVGIVECANQLISHNPRIPGLSPCVSASYQNGFGTAKYYQNGAAHDEGVTGLVLDCIARGVPAQDIAILGRTHGVLRGLKEALPARSIAFTFGEPKKLPPEWVLLKLAIAMMRAPGNWPLFDIWRKRLEKFNPKFAANVTAGRILTTPAESLGFPKNPGAWEALDALHLFGIGLATIEIVREWLEAHPVDTLEALLLALANEEVSKPTGAEGVYVGTIHSAKGREWDTVILAGFEDGILPMNSNREEERRLAYVGITRAKRQLYLCAADRRVIQYNPKFAEEITTGPSPFIAEIMVKG